MLLTCLYWYLPWRKDVVDMFTCGTCRGGRMLLMFTCGICIEGRMLIYLHAVLALEEVCC